MDDLDDQTFLVLNTVVLKKTTTIPGIAATIGADPGEVADIVGRLADEDFVVVFDDQILPDDTAIERVKRFNEERWGELRSQPELDRWHEQFEHVNSMMLAAFTSWQRIRVGGEEISNAHSDAAYDDKIISRIDALIAKVERLLDQLAKQVPRFARYAVRLNDAIDTAQEDRSYITDPRLESVHNIWFEMHEDILLLLGKERAEWVV